MSLFMYVWANLLRRSPVVMYLRAMIVRLPGAVVTAAKMRSRMTMQGNVPAETAACRASKGLYIWERGIFLDREEGGGKWPVSSPLNTPVSFSPLPPLEVGPQIQLKDLESADTFPGFQILKNAFAAELRAQATCLVAANVLFLLNEI